MSSTSTNSAPSLKEFTAEELARIWKTPSEHDLQKWEDEEIEATREFEFEILRRNEELLEQSTAIAFDRAALQSEEALLKAQRDHRAIVQRALDAVDPDELKRLRAQHDEERNFAAKPTRAAAMLFRQTVADALNDRCDFVAFLSALLDFWGEKTVLGVMEDLVSALCALPMKHERTTKLLVSALQKITTTMPDTSAAQNRAQYLRLMRDGMQSLSERDQKLVQLLETRVGIGAQTVFDIVVESALRRLLVTDDCSDDELARAQTTRPQLVACCEDWLADPAAPMIENWRKRWNKEKARALTTEEALDAFLSSFGSC